MFFIFVTLLVFFSFSYSIERTKYIMGIPVSVSTDNPRTVSEVFAVFKKVDKYFSIYRLDSILCKLNREKHLIMDSFFKELLDKSIEIYKETGGYTDISLGNITVVFGDGLETCINSGKNSFGMENLVVKENKIILKKDISLDFGAVGKGFAVDKAVSAIKEKVKKAIINASGEIRCIGSCRIYIKDPFYPEKMLAYFETVLEETGITTSGKYERFYNGKTHLINPVSKESVNNFMSVTLFSDIENVYLDGYATAVSVMPERKAIDFLNRKKIGFVIVKKDKCYLQGRYNDKYIKNLTFVKKLSKCSSN